MTHVLTYECPPDVHKQTCGLMMKDIHCNVARIAELEANAVTWLKYSETKPNMASCPVHSRLFGSMFQYGEKISLIVHVDYTENPVQVGWVYDCESDTFESDEGFTLDNNKVLYFAYLPAPPKENT